MKDAHAYAERLWTISQDPDSYTVLQQRLCRRQRESFTPEATVGRYLDLINRLAQEHDPCRFRPVPLHSVELPREYRLRCSMFWHFLQTCKYRWRTMGTPVS